MAAAAMLRVASSKVNVGRVISLERALLGSIANAFNVGYFSTSSCANTELGHRKLMKLLKSQIKLQKQKMLLRKGMSAVPSVFPFTVKDDDNDDLILTRDFNGEKIEVVIAMLDDMPQDKSSDHDDDNEDDNSKEKKALSLTVTVSKQNGNVTEFEVSASAHEIKVESFSVQELLITQSDEMLAFEVEEEGDLQVALREFLKIRGIDKDYYGFLYKYMAHKRRIGPLVAMTKLTNFIAQD